MATDWDEVFGGGGGSRGSSSSSRRRRRREESSGGTDWDSVFSGSTPTGRTAQAVEREGKPAPQKRSGGGFSLGGALRSAAGAVGRSPIGGFLRTLDIPRAAIVSTARELNDLQEGDGFSTEDWKRQVNRREGVGEWIQDTEGGIVNKDSPLWLKRTLGFVGDVGLDPLTYVTLGSAAAVKGGAGQAARSGARRALTPPTRISSKEVGEMAARRGMTDAAERVLKQRTATALTKAEREVLGIRPGVTVSAVGRTAVIPKSEWVSALRARATNPVFDAVLKTRIGARTRDVFDVKTAFSALRQTDNGRAKVAQAQDVLRRAESEANGFRQQALKAQADMARRNRDAVDIEVVRAIEEPGFVASPASAVAAREVSDYLETWAAKAEQITGTEIPRIEQYVPHQLADEFKEALQDSVGSRARGPAGRQAFERGRENRVGSTWFGQELQEGTLKEMEDIAREALGNNYKQVFRTDPWAITKAYTQGLARMVEREQFFKGLQEFDLVRQMDDEGLAIANPGHHAPQAVIPNEGQMLDRIDAAEGVEAVQTRAATAAQKKAEEARAFVGENQEFLDQARAARLGQTSTINANTRRRIELEAEVAALDPSTRAGQRAAEELTHRQEAERLWAAAAGEAEPTMAAIARLEAVAQARLGNAVRKGERPIKFEEGMAALKQRQAELQDMLDEGFRETTIHGKRVMAEPEVARLAAEVAAWNTPENVKKFFQVTDWLVSRWKAQALLSTGFHIRNYYGGVFNNALAGVGQPVYATFTKGQAQYIRGGLDAVTDPVTREAIGHMERYGIMGGSNIRDISDITMQGTTAEGLISKGIRALPGGPKARAQRAAEHVDPTSLDNGVFRANRWMGTRVEENLRGSLFLDRIQKGFSPEDALAATHKYHFDYSDLAKWESQYAKRAVPFYTWTRKNMPLQIEGMLSKPGLYTRYMHAKRNIELGQPEDEDKPDYYDHDLAIRTGKEQDGQPVYAFPDMPFLGMNESLSQRGALSSVNPFIKTPVEVATNYNTFTDDPLQPDYIKDKEPVPDTWAFLMPILNQLEGPGMPRADKDEDGEWVMNRKDMHKINSLIPVLARARRLGPSEPHLQRSHLSALTSTFLGIGLRTLTREQQETVRRKRTEAEG